MQKTMFLDYLKQVFIFLQKGYLSTLTELTSKFYTLIPHDFGRSVPPVIKTQSVVDQKKELMITLSDIELAQSIQKDKVFFIFKLFLCFN